MKCCSLMGKTVDLISIEEDEAKFSCGQEEFKIYHEQDCCESVSIADNEVNIPNTPFIILNLTIDNEIGESDYEVTEKTIYHFETNKGKFDLEWNGSSNGYYGTSVALYKKTATGTFSVWEDER